MRKLKVYLADLVHNKHSYNYAVPLNIGYIATRVKKKVSDNVVINLFKNPDNLIKALANKPDIVALSNYDWNVNLNRAVISIAREINPDVYIVMGGPNIRKSDEGIRQFLLSSSHIDMYILNEGEDGFYRLVEYILGVWPCHIRKSIIKEKASIPNTAYLCEDNLTLISCKSSDNCFGNQISYPSPWLSGILDTYLNSHSPFLFPIVETNRGCPHQCAYCTWGSFENKKVRKFDLDIVTEELRYIFKKAEHNFHLMITDANFGIFKRDVTIAKEIRRLSDKYQKATGVTIWSSKNHIERNIEIYNILEGLCIPDFAVQTFNKDVLKNIGRKNIDINSIRQFIERVSKKNQLVHTDLLIGLPGESKKMHIESLKQAFDIGFSKIHTIPIRLLSGSKMEEDDYRKKYGIEASWRVIPTAYGTYGGHKVVEYENCISKTDAMSENDLLGLRLFHAYVLFYTLEIGRPLFDFSKKNGLHPIDLIYSMIIPPPKKEYPILSKQIKYYNKQANTEWFDSEEEANAFYFKDDIFSKMMKNGFPKLNYEFGAKLILDLPLRKEFLNWMAFNIKKNLDNIDRSVIDDITSFCFEQFLNIPLDNKEHTIELSEKSYKALKRYMFNNLIFDAKKGSNVLVKLNGDEKKLKSLETRIKRYDGQVDPLLAVQNILQIDYKCFMRDAFLVAA